MSSVRRGDLKVGLDQLTGRVERLRREQAATALDLARLDDDELCVFRALVLKAFGDDQWEQIEITEVSVEELWRLCLYDDMRTGRMPRDDQPLNLDLLTVREYAAWQRLRGKVTDTRWPAE